VAVSDFTTPDDIRSLLGVSTDEIRDETILLPVNEYELAADFDEVDEANDGLVDLYLGLNVGALAPEEDKFYRSVRLFATYAVAKQLLTSLSMFGPKEKTDGKTAVTRFFDPYKETAKRVEAGYTRNRDRLITAFATVQLGNAPTAVLRPYFLVVSSSSDPVTGN